MACNLELICFSWLDSSTGHNVWGLLEVLELKSSQNYLTFGGLNCELSGWSHGWEGYRSSLPCFDACSLMLDHFGPIDVLFP